MSKIFTVGVGIIRGDMIGVEAAAAKNELKSNGLTLFAVELLDEDEVDEAEEDDEEEDDGGVQFWSMLNSFVCVGDKAGGVTLC